MVGAVVVRGGEIVGEGFHAAVGGAHAEVAALTAAGDRARGATLCVTLEPCNHHGRTPPCTEAILAAGIARVVACHRDPDSRVAGSGLERLRRAGLDVEAGPLAERAVRLNLRYLIPKLLGRPAVTLKWAMSLDGKIATTSGESQWISGPRARHYALELREEHGAVLVGSGTVLADDPRLTRRLGRARSEFLRVVLDRRLRVPPAARLFGEPGPVLVYTEERDRERQAPLVAAGAEVQAFDRATPAAVLADLGARGVASLLVEGGGRVAAAFVAAGLYDRVEAVLAPKLIGGEEAPGPLGGGGISALAEAPELDGLEVRRLGDDVLLKGVRRGCLPDLCAKLV